MLDLLIFSILYLILVVLANMSEKLRACSKCVAFVTLYVLSFFIFPKQLIYFLSAMAGYSINYELTKRVKKLYKIRNLTLLMLLLLFYYITYTILG